MTFILEHPCLFDFGKFSYLLVIRTPRLLDTSEYFIKKSITRCKLLITCVVHTNDKYVFYFSGVRFTKNNRYLVFND